jgi:hypothetical protein
MLGISFKAQPYVLSHTIIIMGVKRRREDGGAKNNGDDLGDDFAVDDGAPSAPPQQYLDATSEDENEEGGVADGAPSAEAQAERKAKKKARLVASKERAIVKRPKDANREFADALRTGTAEVAVEAFTAALLRTPAGRAWSAMERDEAVLRPESVAAVSAAALQALVEAREKSKQQALSAKGSARASAAPVPTTYARLGGLEDLPLFIKAALAEGGRWKAVVGWKTAGIRLPKAAPAILILTHSAGRAADMLKHLAVFNCRVAKLFAKHMKPEEQRQALQSGPATPLAVGTPHRVLSLADAGALSLESIELVVWDLRPGLKGETALTPCPVDASGSKRGEGEEEGSGGGGGPGADLARASWSLYAKHMHARIGGRGGSAEAEGKGGAAAAAKGAPPQPLRMAFF